jgi:hypothetical protein
VLNYWVSVFIIIIIINRFSTTLIWSITAIIIKTKLWFYIKHIQHITYIYILVHIYTYMYIYIYIYSTYYSYYYNDTFCVCVFFFLFTIAPSVRPIFFQTKLDNERIYSSYIIIRKSPPPTLNNSIIAHLKRILILVRFIYNRHATPRSTNGSYLLVSLNGSLKH